MILFIARPPALKNMALLYSITTRARRPTAKNLVRTRESSYGCAFLFIGKLHKSLHSIKKSNFKEITLVISNPCGNSFLLRNNLWLPCGIIFIKKRELKIKKDFVRTKFDFLCLKIHM